MKKSEYWDLSKAMAEAKKIGINTTRPTLIQWVKRYALGFQLGDRGGRWFVYPIKFMRYLHGGKTETGTKPNILLVKPDEDKSQEKQGE